MVADELVVAFAPATTPADVAAVAAAAGAQVTAEAPRSGRYVLRFADADAAAAGATVLAASPHVADVERNGVMAGTGLGTSPGLQWNLYAMRLDPLGSWGDAEGVIVAVLDSGVAYEDYADGLGVYRRAPDLAEVDLLPGHDFVNDDAHPNDDQGHGTHVTGVIAASAGIVSMAPGAVVLPVKVLDADNLGSELALSEGIRFAVDSGAQVINLSLSFPPGYFPSRFLQEAVDYADEHGVVLVAAVGNHGENVVAYPAAFRDVIAVGASSLQEHGYHPGDPAGDDDGRRWIGSITHLERAPYSNRGQLVDIAAPGGRIDLDVDGDGFPEGILGETFAAGDPTDFGYYFYAGTSQAAAQVSGLVAVMLAANPDLSPFDVRSLLGETARQSAGRVLSADVGRGFVRADRAAALADSPVATRYRPRYFATVWVTLRKEGAHHRRYARAEVEIIDEDGNPVKGIDVYGTFTGGTYDADMEKTGASGRTVFRSHKLADDVQAVGFQVDAVARTHHNVTDFDRPRGYLRIDSCSLEALGVFGQGLGTSPGVTGTGGAQSASASSGSFQHEHHGGTSGSGLGTSPGSPRPGDLEEVPLSIAYAPDIAGKHYVPTVMLPNFGWGVATAPMAVAVDEAWFLATFPGASSRLVVSHGTGLAGSPLLFDPATSFPSPIVLPDRDGAECIPLIALTFAAGSGLGTSPGYLGGSGLGTSPGAPGSGPDAGFLPLYPDPRRYGADSAACLGVLLGFWEYWSAVAAGDGLGTSPGWTADTGMDKATFDQLGDLIQIYVGFGGTNRASPVAAYGNVLDVLGVGQAPVPPEADGIGHGVASAGF